MGTIGGITGTSETFTLIPGSTVTIPLVPISGGGAASGNAVLAFPVAAGQSLMVVARPTGAGFSSTNLFVHGTLSVL